MMDMVSTKKKQKYTLKTICISNDNYKYDANQSQTRILSDFISDVGRQ